MKKFDSKKVILIMIVLLVLTSFNINVVSKENIRKTGIENLPYKQEIKIPFDTSVDEAKFQPVDTNIVFEKTCWGRDEINHSIRVAYDAGSGLNEIDSQIYDLEKTDDNHISSCNLVFLIPEDADGKEKYYVLYSDKETKQADYVDHVGYEDTHYSYEPISGQKISTDYFKILEDGFVICGICQKGELFGEGLSHTIIKMKKGSKVFETYNTDMFASFAMSYSAEGGNGYKGAAYATKISKSVLVDGNLMVKLKITGESPEGVTKTDIVYTYYYSPTDTKRLLVDGTNEVLKTHTIGGDQERDPSYATLTSFKSRSSTIEKMNVGNILPTLHVFDENGNIQEYNLPPDPDTSEAQWILRSTDDIDLGKKTWACQDNPATGKAYGIIFEKNKGYLEGSLDGIQIKQTAKQLVKLPGLEADLGSLFFCRNSYEKDGKHDTVIEEGTKINFRGEFVSFETGGYEAVDKESEIFQKLSSLRPVSGGNITEGEKQIKYNLTAYAHFGRSIPLGSLLSAALGKNISYINAELYKDDGTFMSSGTVSRLQTTEGMDLSFENTTFIEKIKIALGLFDWKNFSFFKKIIFPGLEPGRYLVKIYRENPLFKGQHQYIGFSIVEIEKDTVTHVFCRPEGSLKFSVNNQKDNGVENVKFELLSDNVTISDGISDKNGTTQFTAPCNPLKPYVLKVSYNGFLIDEKNVKIGLLRKIKPYTEAFNLDLYQLKIRVKDSWGLSPAVELNPGLTSEEMIEKISIPSEKTNKGEYVFRNLLPATYTLSMSYKSFDTMVDVKFDKDKNVDVVFPAEFNIEFNIMDSYSSHISNGNVQLSRENKRETVKINENGRAVFSVPPGEYEIEITDENDVIGKQKIDVRGDKKIDVVTSKGSMFHTFVTLFGFIVLLFSIVFMLWKKRYYQGLRFFIIGILIIALVSPWWVLTGDNGTTSTNTKTMLIPSKIVSLTESDSVIGGEISMVPEEATMAFGLLALLVIVTIIILFITVFTKTKFNKITKILSIIGFVLLLVIVLLFYYVMSQITMIGVGSFSGSGDLDITIPGIAASETLNCSWGPGLGFILSVVAIAVMLFVFLLKRWKPYLIS